MNLQWAKAWMKTYAKPDGPQEVVDMWAPEGPIVFEDPLLEMVIADRDELPRSFEPYNNTDPSNGIGIHTFDAMEYFGDERWGVTHWTWSAEHCATFLGIPTGGKQIGTTGTSVHTFDEHGKITRELAYWDAVKVGKSLGLPFELTKYYVLDEASAAR